MESEDITILKNLLADILNPDNEPRKIAERELLTLKANKPEEYWIYLFRILLDVSNNSQIRVLWAVLLRSSFLSSLSKDKNLWIKISSDIRDDMFTKVLQLAFEEEDRQVTNAVANLISEIIGSLYELEDQVRDKEPHELCIELIKKNDPVKAMAALNIYIGMFDKIAEQMMQYKSDLMEVFTMTIGSQNNEVAFLGLKAVWKIIVSLERKDSNYFKDISNNIFELTEKVMNEKDEEVVEKILIELKDLASAEPMFFMNNFDKTFSVLEKIMHWTSFDKPSIRIMPIELLSTVVVRLKTKFTKNIKVVKQIVNSIYTTMVTIDDEISDEWLNPEDGCKIEEEEFSIDPVHVGSKWIDSFIRELGQTKMRPIIQDLIESKLRAKDASWKDIHSWLMIVALLGEYIDNINDVEPFVELAIKYLIHENPKVRYAAIHTIGQMSTDLQPAFQAQFCDKLMVKLIKCLSDKYPRIQAHTCASLTNFLEGATDDIVENHVEELWRILVDIIKNGNTMCKENGITWLATVAEASESKFREYYCDVIKEISVFLTSTADDVKYYQFQGQLIEAIVIMSVSVGYEYFKVHADGLIRQLLVIQNKIFEEVGDCTNSTKTSEHHILQSYLLTAWEKLWYLMGKDFAEYLEGIIDNLLRIASLNPEFKTSENEVLIHQEEDSQSNLVTSEIDEKNSALEMIESFVKELKEKYYPYVNTTSMIIVPLLTYKQSETVRKLSANCLHGLMIWKIEGSPDDRAEHELTAREFIKNVWFAVEKEKETEILGAQLHAVRDIINDMKTPFLIQSEVENVCNLCIEMIFKSDKRKAINNDYASDNIDPNDENVDHQDLELMQNENYNEDEFQIAVSEIFGALFKTHKEYWGYLCHQLFERLLPEYLQDSSDPNKKRFALYILVDMVEHLGYIYISEQYPHIIEILTKFSLWEITALRQSAIYGIGVALSLNCDLEMFTNDIYSYISLIKNAVEIPLGDQDKEEYDTCKDNAISAFGKILKHYEGLIREWSDTSPAEFTYNSLFEYWHNLLPLKLDMPESKIMFDFLADKFESNPELVVGEGFEKLLNLFKLVGEHLHELYMNKETIVRFGKIINHFRSLPELKEMVDQFIYFDLDDLPRKRIEKAMDKANQDN